MKFAVVAVDNSVDCNKHRYRTAVVTASQSVSQSQSNHDELSHLPGPSLPQRRLVPLDSNILCSGGLYCS